MIGVDYFRYHFVWYIIIIMRVCVCMVDLKIDKFNKQPYGAANGLPYDQNHIQNGM